MFDKDMTLVGKDNMTYYPLRQAAEENAGHLYEVDSPCYRKLVNRNLQMFRKWLSKEQVRTHSINNERCIPEALYDVFVDLVRSNQAARILGVSRSTMARLKADGILVKIEIPGTKTTFLSYRQISDAKTIRIVERRRRIGNKLESVIPIEKLKYYAWG
jgi:hypothetical protein